MKLGIITWSFRFAMGRKIQDYSGPQKMDIFAFIHHVKELGLDGYQCELPYLTDDERLSQIRKLNESLGLYIEVAGWGVNPNDLIPQIVKAHKVGAKVLRTALGGLRINTWDKRLLADELKEKKEQLRSVIPELKKYNIRLAVENHQDALLEEFLDILDSLDREWIGSCPDSGNNLLVAENPALAFEKLLPYAYACHFKDFTIRPTSVFPAGGIITGVALGQGIFDLHRMIEQIRRLAPHINVTIENQLEPKATPEESVEYEENCARESVRYARKVLNIH